mgnify:CR=1 FL=1
MKTVSQIYISLFAYSINRALHKVWIPFSAIEACGLLFLIAGASFLHMEGVVILLTASIYVLMGLFFFVQDLLNSREMLAVARQPRVNPMEACREFLHKEASKRGLHMRDPKVYRKARIYFSERILTRTLLKLEG